jgi:FixJ family two-component response regulator
MTSSIVYIVDDDISACKSMEALLGSRGIVSQSFKSGEELLESIQSCQTPICLLADYRLPGMNGIALLAELARLNKCVATVMLTAYATTRLTVEAIRSGAITVLEKPIREQELWDEISRAITTSSQQFEMEVLEMVLKGQPNKSISKQLNLSSRTIENRRQQIYLKTGTNSVAALVKLVVEIRVREQLAPRC